MVVAFMQILDTSVTNVVLPHLQGSLSAGLEEVSWVITSYLAANAERAGSCYARLAFVQTGVNSAV